MSVTVAGNTKFYILVTFYSSVLHSNTSVSIYDTDIVLESFEAHKSICSDASFRFGGCVSEWVKFTTAVTTYKVGYQSYPIPWEDATIQLGFGEESDTPGYTDVTYLGTYTGTEYKLNAKHTQVTVTAYDLMYKLVNYDMTSWYTSYVANYPSGRALTSFYTDFMNELTTQVGISTYDTPAVFSNVQFSARYTWQPYPRTPVDDGNGGTYMQEMTLFDGTVTGGMLLKGLCEATGTNAYMSAEGTKVALYDLAYYNNTNFYFPLESYSDLDYGTEDLHQPSTFRITAYNITYTSSPGSTDYYPITDNWVFNSMANIEIIDDPDIGDDSTPIQSIANLLNVRYRQAWRPAVLTSFGTTTVGGVEYDVKYLEIGTTAAIRLSDNTLIYSPRMQRDMYGIVGVKIEHTALRPYNWRKDGGVDAENASITATNEIGSKISTKDSTGTVTWAIKPSGWDVQVNGSSVLEIDGNGLSLSGYAKTSDIPTVNNATLTIQKNGSTVATFTANQSTAATANITVPTTAAEVGALPVAGGATTVSTPATFTDIRVNNIPQFPAGTIDYFLGIEAFASGGRIKWQLLSDVKTALGVPTTASEVGAVPTSGGAVSGAITRDSGDSWISARDNCVVKQTRQTQTQGNSWNPVVGIKTWAGHWSLGTVGAESLMLSYDTDANYSGGTNTSATISFPAAGSSGTLALTSQIPSSADFVVKSLNNYQRIIDTNTGQYSPIVLQSQYSGVKQCVIGFAGNDGVILGYLGINSSGLPIYTQTGATQIRIALFGDNLSNFANDLTYINTRGNYIFDASTAPKTHPLGISTGFVNDNSGFGSYGSVLTVRSYNGGGGTLQLYAPYSPTYGGTRLKARFGNYDVGSGNTWTELKEIAWLEDVTSAPWSGGTITSSGNAYSSSGAEVGWYAGFGSTRYLALVGGKSSGKTGLLDVVADTWVLEGLNSTSGYNKWIYHGKLGTNRFQCGTLAFSAAGANSVTFSGAFGGVPVVSLTVQGSSNVYVRTYSLTASTMYITVSGACTVHWMAYYNA